MTDEYQAGSLPDVFRLVEQLHKKLMHVRRETVRQTGLTPPQYATLTQLWELDGQPPKDLAAGNACTPATMTTIIDGLERKSLVTRKPHPSDRRSLLVHLTQDGAKLRGSSPTVGEMFRGCCSGLAPDESQNLAGLLAKLDAALSAWQPGEQT
ncbi:MAG: MarR family transcriptional regulator [Acidimicrobiia bacterium]|nr:MarR family transcriptional regulator [Acidimicrobiia bacterium]